jgi:XTP/dITP diphosphohydrolase
MEIIYIATTNAGKLRDFAGAASLFGISVASLPGFASLEPVEEDGDAFATNAIKKAVAYSSHAPEKLVLADDSGLEVAALDGAPGVRSARYAAADSQTDADAANNARLLRELASVPDEKRVARFVCVLAAAQDGYLLHTFVGEVRGRILREARGTHGFGYDPLFFIPELGKTTAELSAEEKAAVSHRGHAFRRFLEWYRTR